MRKALVTVMLVALGVMALAPVAFAQGYEPTVTVCVDVKVGPIDTEGRVTLIGPPRCTPPGVVVDIHIDDTIIGQTRSLEDGSFSSSVAIPPRFTGSQRLVLRAGDQEIVVPIEVTPAAARTDAPNTGDTMTLMWVVVGLAGLAAAGFFGWKRLPMSAHRRPTEGDAGVSRIDTTHFVPQRPELAGTGPERREEETSG